METLIAYKAWGVGALFLTLFGLERLYPATASVGNNMRRLARNFSFWPLNLICSVVVILPVSYFAAGHALWTRPMVASSAFFDLLVLDLFLYWWHRAMHEVPILWRFHQVHHLDEHLDTTSALRFHFGEVLISSFVRAFVIMLFALPFTSVVLFEALVLAAALFHHSNWAMSPHFERLLSKVIITPSIHWVHHHAVRTDTDSNYGTVLSSWDRLFKTKSPTLRTPNMMIGVEGQGGVAMKDKAFLRLLKLPFSRL